MDGEYLGNNRLKVREIQPYCNSESYSMYDLLFVDDNHGFILRIVMFCVLFAVGLWEKHAYHLRMVGWPCIQHHRAVPHTSLL